MKSTLRSSWWSVCCFFCAFLGFFPVLSLAGFCFVFLAGPVSVSVGTVVPRFDVNQHSGTVLGCQGSAYGVARWDP